MANAELVRRGWAPPFPEPPKLPSAGRDLFWVGVLVALVPIYAIGALFTGSLMLATYLVVCLVMLPWAHARYCNTLTTRAWMREEYAEQCERAYDNWTPPKLEKQIDWARFEALVTEVVNNPALEHISPQGYAFDVIRDVERREKRRSEAQAVKAFSTDDADSPLYDAVMAEKLAEQIEQNAQRIKNTMILPSGAMVHPGEVTIPSGAPWPPVEHDCEHKTEWLKRIPRPSDFHPQAMNMPITGFLECKQCKRIVFTSTDDVVREWTSPVEATTWP